ncbi:hypothetical protein LTR10_013284 [Elasticomyces elasticus]|nr:hypothetical protein LTR10_013284 [Elasticomyces elasticus]KAK5034808.1 hypothetical protein LTR13_005990 [Exophiala sideris]KAK5181054.1 hypothetical protein LTR44_006385 [Eurotiomycetes sp. CCFEE 6388]
MQSATRSQTRDLKSFTLELGSGLVTFSFPSTHRTRITIPPGSLWSPGAHWHETYTEHMRVLQGQVKFTIDGTAKVIGPEDGVHTIRKYEVHDFCRADGGSGDEDVMVEEWTEPDDGFKQVFFYNVLSLFKDSLDPTTQKAKLSPGLAVQLLRTIAHVDNFVDPLPFLPSSVSVLFAVKYILTHSVYGLGKVLGSVLGYQVWFKGYTPEESWDVAERGATLGKVEGRGKKE